MIWIEVLIDSWIWELLVIAGTVGLTIIRKRAADPQHFRAYGIGVAAIAALPALVWLWSRFVSILFIHYSVANFGGAWLGLGILRDAWELVRAEGIAWSGRLGRVMRGPDAVTFACSRLRWKLVTVSVLLIALRALTYTSIQPPSWLV